MGADAPARLDGKHLPTATANKPMPTVHTEFTHVFYSCEAKANIYSNTKEISISLIA
jgi:hypothetical protein